MHRRTIWSLCKRLLPIPMVLVMLCSNFEAVTVIAGEPTVDEPSSSDPDNSIDEEDPEDAGNPDGDDAGKTGNPNEGDPNEGNPNAGTPDATDPNAADPNAANPDDADPNAADPNAADPNALDPNAIDPALLGMGDGTDPMGGINAFGARGINSINATPGDEGDTVSKSIVISSNISNIENSGFEISLQSQNAEECSDDNGTYTFILGEEADSADIVFSYTLANKYFALEDVSVSGGGVEFEHDADAHAIKCSFANVEEGEHSYTITGTVVKTDSTGPEISDIKVADETPTYGSGDELSAYSTDRSDLTVTAVVTDDDSGVDKVCAVDSNGNTYDMNLSDGVTHTYTWTPNTIGNYKIVKIEATDKADNTSNVAPESKILCYYNNGEKPGVTIANEEWYSVTANNGKKLPITISGTTVRKIEKICISDFESDVDAVSTFGADGYTINQNIDLPDVPGVTEYIVACKFYGDEEATEIGRVTAKIDDKAPEGEVEIDTVEETHQPTGILGFLYNLIPNFSSKDITVLIKVPKNCDDDSSVEEVSGLYSVTYTVDGIQYTKTLDELDRRHTDNEYYVFSHVIASGTDEKVTLVSVDNIADAAGNKTLKDKRLLFAIDPEAPRVYYTTNGNSSPEGDRLFFTGEISGTVTVEDLGLDEESIDFENHHNEKYSKLKPVLNKEASTLTTTDPNAPKKYVYDFSTSEDGEYMITTYAKDIEGHETPNNGVDSPIMVLDNTAPEIEISYDKSEPSEGGETFYNSNVGVTVTVKDRWIDKSRSVVTLKKIDENGAESVVGPLNDWSGELGDDEHKISFSTDGDGIYKVIVEAYDIAGNHSSKESSNFTVDATAPKVEISFDKSDAMNGKYYNETRTATVTVTDFTFNETTAGLKIEEKYGSANVGAWTQTSGSTYTCTVTFDKDGMYELSCESEDKAHNKSDKVSEPEFVIDKTAPEINVTYNAAEAKNGNFYKDARIATVNIKEISFDNDGVKIETQPLSEVGALPSVGAFSSSDDSNIAQMKFDQDGTYGYTINCTDLAGNTATNYISDVFIIDTTAPTVEFSGVENYSANNAEVAPAVVYGDKYIDIDASNVSLRGANKGMVQMDNNIVAEESGFVVRYNDFAHDEGTDDLYFLEANVYDKAGNASEDKLVFSVNRHGSVFIVGDGTKALNEKYYTNEPKDVVITEINIDDLTRKDVSVSRDGNISKLTSGRDYNVSKEGDETSWKTYTYDVKSSNFNKDGIYSVTIFSQDKATNIQDNKTRDAEVSFAVDMSAPSIVTAGIEENTHYKEASHTFNVDVNDNMGVSSLVIYVDGKPVDIYDEERFDNTKDISVTLNESDETQTITIIAEDVAGNKEINVYAGVLVSTKEINDPNVPGGNGGKGGKGETNPSRATAQAILFAIVAMGAIVAITGASVLIYRKRVK